MCVIHRFVFKPYLTPIAVPRLDKPNASRTVSARLHDVAVVLACYRLKSAVGLPRYLIDHAEDLKFLLPGGCRRSQQALGLDTIEPLINDLDIA